jgi:predicted SnoaL-like aldol condensation-catalyzing enzyme
MPKTIEETNKALVLEAFDALFNMRDYQAAERYWSPKYSQHSAHIAPGRDGLFNLIKSAPSTLRYQHGAIVSEKHLAIVHGRFSGHGRPRSWIAADVVRIAMACVLSIGTSRRTKRPTQSRKAVCPCSAHGVSCITAARC